ncbi:hypothetical protein BX666DRAFT_2023471 [Dichotomocladium elegans]|nr:hypothetical protein BX666DRAFT_2023471 [Dichotomocladium elegans]
MAPSSLELVLQYAYIHGFTCREGIDVKWAEPVKVYLKEADGDETPELCAEPLLERYIAFAITGDDEQHFPLTLKSRESLIQPTTFLKCLSKFAESSAIRNPHQWSHILKCLPAVLAAVDPEKVIYDLLNQKEQPWPKLLCDVFVMLSRIVAVGLYHEHYAKEPIKQEEPAPSTSSQQFNTQASSYHLQFTLSQRSGFDPDATLDLEAFAEDTGGSDHLVGSTDGHAVRDSTQGTSVDADRIETTNAIMASQIMVDLIEKKRAKMIFEIMHNQVKRELNNGEMTQNTSIQKLLLLVNRLTDRELDRRMAVHLKYQELEDEGTARALPSAGLMGFLYHMVQIRPGLDDESIVDYLSKLQTIKGSFDESFFLEIWFAGLTGLRETFELGANRNKELEKEDIGSDSIIITNRLLWRSLVLIKIPHIIEKLQARRQGSAKHVLFIKREINQDEDHNFNPLESSLMELKSFSGLLNGCTSLNNAFEMFAPLSSKLLNKVNPESNEDDEDDIMKLIKDMNNPVDLSTPAVMRAIRSVGNEDIFTSIVRVCQSHGLVRKNIAEKLLATSKIAEHEDEQVEHKPDVDLLDDVSMLDFGDEDVKIPANNSSDIDIISQNVNQRINALKENVSMTAITELLHIAMVSMIHAKQIVDFLIELLQEKVSTRDIFGIAKICDALNRCTNAIDLIGQLYHPSVLLSSLEELCNEWKPSDNELYMDDRSGYDSQNEEDMDGIRALYGKFGKIWTLVLYRTLASAFKYQDGFCYQFFSHGPLIYGFDAKNDSIESFIHKWQTALLGNDGLSDDLLRYSTPQQLLQAAPTLFAQAVLVHENGHIDINALLGIVSYFQECFLSFTLFSGPLTYLCDDLLWRNPSVAILCLRQLLVDGQPPNTLLQISGNYILEALMGLSEQLRQESIICTSRANGKGHAQILALEEQLQSLRLHVKSKLRIERKSERKQHHTETVSTGVTCRNLSQKTQDMFRYIVKSGRSMFMRDVDADIVALWDSSKAPKSVIVHYLDMVMFQTALDMGGPHWFVSMITSEVLEAGRSGGAIRAAELGSCLIATPLAPTPDGDTACHNLLRCLLQDVVPSFLKKHAEAKASFFQGQTLGVFTGDCLVLLHGRREKQAEWQFIDELGRQFLETIVIDRENAPRIIHQAIKREKSLVRVGAFAPWPDVVVESPIWRGFLKGLMSNPLINEAWPNTFVY